MIAAGGLKEQPLLYASFMWKYCCTMQMHSLHKATPMAFN